MNLLQSTVFRHVLVALQLALILLVVGRFHLAEGLGFPKLLPVVFFGFLVHSAVPAAWRLPTFVGLTMVGIFLVFNATQAAWMIGIALLLIGLCHLPVNYWVRVALVVAAATVLALIQLEVIAASDRIRFVIPILGTIFMFRLAIYLYDLRHEKVKAGLWKRLAYFFMLPNPVFPLFPVIDYKTFLRTYYGREAITIYQKGVLWMARGVVHLLLYRVVYYYLVPPYEEINTLAGVGVFAVTAYLLYLRVSGLFHLVIGSLCLFGFDLPETHKRYLLASGFSDYWRRINIYWKDFMAKLVFFPTFAQVRRFGYVPGLVIATGVVFFVTWILHSYQHLWLQGGFPITLVDGLFWGIFGLLVMINTVFEAKRGSKGKLAGLKGGRGSWNGRAAWRLSVQTAAMFALMCLLWSMWTSPSLDTWTSVMSQAVNEPVSGVLIILAVLAGGVVIGTFAQYLHHRGVRFELEETAPQWRLVLGTAVPMLLALALWYPTIHTALGAEGLVKSLRGGMLNQRDQRTLERGYYEGLLVPNNMTSALWATQFGDDEDAGEQRGRLLDPERFLPTNDLLFREHKANVHTEEFGKSWSTNRWGMRDKDYTEKKPEGVTRIAVLGASYVMGKRVPDGTNFESLLEDQLNTAGMKVEILNFAVDAYSPLEGVLLCRDKIGRFDIDHMFYIEHGSAGFRLAERLAERMVSGIDLQFDYLNDLKWEARAYPGTDSIDANRRLFTRADELLGWAYGEMATLCKAQGIQPHWVLLPRTRENNTESGLAEVEAIAERAGMDTLVIDDPYGDSPIRDITVARHDFHPNELGHRLIADRFYEVLTKNRVLEKSAD